jgi:hypothetical protein
VTQYTAWCANDRARRAYQPSTHEFVERTLEELYDVMAFDVRGTETLRPSDENAVINALLTKVESGRIRLLYWIEAILARVREL